jgi:hypothetical protein
MAGEIKKMINKIIAVRSNGNAALANTTKAKFMLKGINPDNYNNLTADDPDVISKIKEMATKLNITI